ncbi:hypothetical protein HDV06_003266 [Boothiomyces sp. JEL0866]|nr:hypothetical protein HDV06_003266 [Boothiomyces sp. JEL0866]
MLPIDSNWEWGLGVPKSSLAEKLPAFEDDLITKSLQYTNPGATVDELMEVMDCMESASGVRALVTVHIDQISSTTELKERQYREMSNYCGNLLHYSFETEITAKKSTEDFIRENSLELVEFVVNNSSLTKTEAKRKPENISDITNLIKKKKK